MGARNDRVYDGSPPTAALSVANPDRDALAKTRQGGTVRRVRALLDHFAGTGWDVRLVSEPNMLVSSLVVDDVGVVDYEYLNDYPGPYIHENARDVAHYTDQFENYWRSSIPASALQTLFDDTELVVSAERDAAIVVASTQLWDELIAALMQEPRLLHTIDPRKFEELVAELLSRENAEVTLTPASKDGGRDVLAFYNTPVGRHLYLVECKRYAPERKVGVSLVRSLFGVVMEERATAGLLVTTSSFTRGALQFKDRVRNQIGLRGYADLEKWLARHGRRDG